MSDKLITFTGSRKGKRFLTAKQVLEAQGQNPVMNMIRLAIRAEKEDKLNTAMRGWAEIQCYVEAKKKSIDPVEQLDRLNRMSTMQELQQIREKILEGTVLDAEYTDVPLITADKAGIDLI